MRLAAFLITRPPFHLSGVILVRFLSLVTENEHLSPYYNNRDRNIVSLLALGGVFYSLA